VLNLAFVLSYFLKFDQLHGLANTPYVNLWMYVNAAWLLITALFRPNEIPRKSRVAPIIGKYFLLGILHLLLVSVFWVVFKAYYYSREQILETYLFFFTLLFIWKVSLIYFLRIYRKKGFNYRNVVIVGYGELAEQLRGYFMRHPEFGYRFLGYFDRKYKGPRVLGKVDEVFNFVKDQKVDEIYCCLPHVRYTQVNKLVNFAEENLIKVKVIADIRGFSAKSVDLEYYDHLLGRCPGIMLQ